MVRQDGDRQHVAGGPQPRACATASHTHSLSRCPPSLGLIFRSAAAVRAEPDTGARRQQFCSPVRDSADPVEQSLRNKLANIALFWCGTNPPAFPLARQHFCLSPRLL